SPAPAGPGGDHVFHHFVVESHARDALREHLGAYGIATAVHYPVPIHRTAAYAPAGLTAAALPAVEERARRICSLPMHPAMDDREIARVAAAVHEFSPR
ncbi:MAG: aminotransferase, partial [Solirubrobacterales bacterium]|nr:aminotransferase [Solirubrobacterales bacterium]